MDGVVAALFGGGVSPDTRAVLLSGENPLLASPRARASLDSLAMTAGADATDPNAATTAGTMSGTMSGTSGDVQRRRAERRSERRGDDPAAVAREAVKAGRAQPMVAGTLPPLNGFAQIVGLAFGAPEFQRR